MAKEEQTKACCEDKRHNKMVNHAGGGAVYGLGFIGALVYYVQTATSFGMGLLGVLKSIVWPAMLIYQLLTLLKM